MASEIDLNALIASLSCWEIAGYSGLVIVIIGVVGEAVHEWVPLFSYVWWRANGGRLSVLVLIAGLAIEGVAQVKANSISGQIIAFLSDRAATLEGANLRLRERVVILEAKLAPKNLTDDQVSELTQRIRHLCAGAKAYLLWNPDQDAANRLGIQLREILTKSLGDVFGDQQWKLPTETSFIGIDIRKPQPSEDEKNVGEMSSRFSLAACVEKMVMNLRLHGIDAVFNSRMRSTSDRIEIRIGTIPWQ
jgi:hypothetical protein